MHFIYVAPHAWRQRRFLLTIYVALLPKGAPGSAGWVSNTTHYDCCHYRRMQERNPFGQPARIPFLSFSFPLLHGITCSNGIPQMLLITFIFKLRPAAIFKTQDHVTSKCRKLSSDKLPLEKWLLIKISSTGIAAFFKI